MKVKVVKQDEKTLILELPGESYTLTNVIRDELWENTSVSEAAQIKEHPYLAEPKIFVKTSRGLPTTALKRAASRIISQVDEFKSKFKSALK